MAIGKDGTVLRQLHALFHMGTFGDLTDGQLLERFAIGWGEARELAFAVLVQRHGPMVLRVCRSVLRDSHDAQDAFQATFLVLSGKARGLWVRDSLGPWLHQVAYRTARCARSSSARRKRLERRAALREDVNTQDEPNDERERILHEEIERLPERYRAPLVLCDLEGRTHEQAARHLGWPIGTVKSRQSRGRQRLRERLVRRGYASSPEMFLIALKSGGVEAMVPPALLDATTRAVIHSLTLRIMTHGPVSALAQEVLKSMSFTKWWKAATVLVALSATVSGAAVFAQKEKGDEPSQVAPNPNISVVTVKAGPLKSTVSERGTLEAANASRVISEVEGMTTIISIKPEGTMVHAKELIAELDSAVLRDKLINQEIATAKAGAAFENAQITREVAEIGLREYLEGTFPQEKKTLEGAILTADSAIQRAEARRERIRLALARLKPFPDAQAAPSEVLAELELNDRLDRIEQEILREKLGRDLAKGKLDILTKFTQGRITRELNASLQRESVDEHTAKNAFDLEKRKEAKLRQMITKCKLYAPIDGIVLYANGVNIRQGVATPQIEEGATVRERQILFSVIDLNGPMRVNAKIPEAWVDRLMPRQVAKVTVDALPNQEFAGVVKLVQPLPDPHAFATWSKKVYTTLVEITKGSPQLRPGMTATVDILTADLANALTVPQTAVIRRDNKTQVAVKKPDGGFDWRVVTLGVSDATRIEIKTGLKEGDTVVEHPNLLLPAEPKGEKTPAPAKP